MTRLFHDFLVRWVQQLHWPTSSLTDVKDSFTQAVSPKSFLFYLPLLKDWTFSPTEGVSRASSNPAPKHIAGRTGACPMSCPSICEAIQITSIASTEERARMQVPTRDPLWENQSLRSFNHGQRSDQWRVSPSQCWKLRQLEFGRHLRPCVGKIVLLLCDGFQESCCYQESGCLLQFPARSSKNEQSIEQLLPCCNNISICATVP